MEKKITELEKEIKEIKGVICSNDALFNFINYCDYEINDGFRNIENLFTVGLKIKELECLEADEEEKKNLKYIAEVVNNFVDEIILLKLRIGKFKKEDINCINNRSLRKQVLVANIKLFK